MATKKTVTAPVKSAKVPSKKPLVSVADVLKERYEVVEQLGQGSYGAVYKVKDKKTGEQYALKIELEIPKTNDLGLTSEITAIKWLQGNSPHVARYVDAGKFENLNFVIIQLLVINLLVRSPSKQKIHAKHGNAHRITMLGSHRGRARSRLLASRH